MTSTIRGCWRTDLSSFLGSSISSVLPLAPYTVRKMLVSVPADWVSPVTTVAEYITYNTWQITHIKLCFYASECFPRFHILGSVTHFADNVDRAWVQHVEQSGSQTISPVFSQPALTWKDVLDTFGWHGNRQLIHQPAALWCDTIMAELRRKREKGREREREGVGRQKWELIYYLILFDLGTRRHS